MAANIYRVLGPLQVETKTNWADPWVVRPNIEPLNGSAACEAVGQFQFRVRYGMLKHPSETVLSWHDYTQINRDWVRVKAAPYTDADILFMGRVESDSRELHGPANGVSGVQTFTAYDGVQLLNKRIVSESVVEETATDYKKHEVLLHVNKPNYGRSFIGNRSLTLRNSGGIPHYVYLTNDGVGTPENWTVADFIRYVVAEFVGGSGNPAIDPLWQVTIPAGELTDIVEPMSLPVAATVIEMISAVLSRKQGWTWCVVPNATGYEIRFSTTTATGTNFNGETVSANPNVLTVNTNDPNASISLERSQVQSYGKIRVIGKPMVVCGTFDTRNVHGAFNEPNVDVETTSDYTFTGGNTTINAVERKFQVRTIPLDLTGQHLPTVNDDGTLDTTVVGPIPSALNTLESLPLQNDHDYEYLPPPVSINESNLMTPFILSTEKTDGVTHEYYDKSTGGSLYTLPTRIGLHAKDVDESEFDFDQYDHFVTVAYEAAQRLSCYYAIPGASDSDGEYVIEVDDAELWWLAEDTIVKVNQDGTVGTMNATGVELRNDRQRLYRIMAGAIARYIDARCRASVRFQGLWLYQQSLGMILGTVADATDANTIAAPITGVQWQFEGDHSTIVSTGFAI